MSEQGEQEGPRRRFLRTASVIGAATMLGLDHRPAVAEVAPEITRIRLTRSPAMCTAPSLLAQELFGLEGFSQVEYVNWVGESGGTVVSAGQADISMVPVRTPYASSAFDCTRSG